MFLWPRYFFISIAGKGVSLFTAMTLVMLLQAVYFLFTAREIQSAALKGWRQSLPLIAALNVFFAWSLWTDVIGFSPTVSLGITLQDILFSSSWMLIASVYFCFPGSDRILLRTIAIAALVATAMGLLEFVTQTPLLDALGLSGLAVGDNLKAINFASSSAGSLRIKSVFSHPIVYGQVMALFAPFALHFLTQARAGGKMLSMAMFVGIALAMVICESRSPLALVPTALVAYYVIYNLDLRNSTRFLRLLTLLIASVLLLPIAIESGADLINGTSSDKAGSTMIRNIQYQRMQTALVDRPFVGHGAGQAGYMAGVEGRNDVLTVDSIFISTSVERGYFGTVLLCVLFLAMAIKGARSTLAEQNPQRRSLLAGLTAWTIAIPVGLSIISIPDEMVMLYLAGGFFIAAAGLRAQQRALPAPAQAGANAPAIAAARRRAQARRINL